MEQGDILIKKWCFGIGRAKPRTELAQNAGGEAQTFITYPKYRTIVFKVLKAEKKNGQWLVEGDQYIFHHGKPKASVSLDSGCSSWKYRG